MPAKCYPKLVPINTCIQVVLSWGLIIPIEAVSWLGTIRNFCRQKYHSKSIACPEILVRCDFTGLLLKENTES